MATKNLSKTRPKALVTGKTEKQTSGNSAQAVRAERRYAMIQEAAYFRAQKAGFSGDCCDHWLAAEKEIDRKLRRN